MKDNMDKNISQILQSTKQLVQNSDNFMRYINEKVDPCYNRIFKHKLPEIKDKIIHTKTLDVDPYLIGITNDYYNQSQLPLLQSSYLTESSNEIHNNTQSKVLHRVHHHLKVSSDLVKPSLIFKNSRNTSNHIFPYDIFSDIGYSNKVYDESLIFRRSDFYSTMIQEKMEYFKTHENLNSTNILTKKYYNKTQDENELFLTLHSLKIKFTKITNDSSTVNKPIEINFPFALLPFFYYQGVSVFKYVLLSLVTFKNNYTEIEINEKEFYNLLRNEYKTNENASEEEAVQLDFVKMNTGKREIRNPPSYKLKRGYNIFRFNWETPQCSFNVEITLPLIQLSVANESLYITKYIDTELLLYLYSENFVNWDFYVSNYLFSFKRFRRFIELTYSKHKGSKRNLKEHQQRVLHLTEEKIKMYCDQDISLTYLYTNSKNENSIHCFQGYSLMVTDESLPGKTEYFFRFNFHQTKLLIVLNQLMDLRSLLNKLVIVDSSKSTISIDYSFFDNCNLDLLETTALLSSPPQKKGKICYSVQSRKIELLPPRIETKSFQDGAIVMEEWNDDAIFLPKAKSLFLLQTEIFLWPPLLAEFSQMEKLERANRKHLTQLELHSSNCMRGLNIGTAQKKRTTQTRSILKQNTGEFKNK